MKTAIPGLLAVVLLGTTASAEPLRLNATTRYTCFYRSDFIILFDDTGDGLLQLGEVTSFSGIFDPFGTFHTGIDGIPQIENISTAGGSCDLKNYWCFSDLAFQVYAGFSTYAITSADSAPALNVSRSTVPGCQDVAIGTVLLRNPAPAGGRIVPISDTLPAAITPASVTVPEDATTQAFLIRTTRVTTTQSGTITAKFGAALRTRNFSVRPIGVWSVSFGRNKSGGFKTTVVGTNTIAATAFLECEAGPGPITVDLASSDAAAANPVAASVVVPQGGFDFDRAEFDVATSKVLSNTTVSISATANGITKSRTLTVTPASFVTPTTLKFGTVPVGVTSGPRAATLTNKGTIPFTIGSIGISGPNPGAFAMTENCPAILAAGASCSVNATFKPTAATSRIAKLSIATSARAVPLIVWLTGTGT